MNPLPPPLAVSAAYVALSDKPLGARLMAAIRSPGQALAMTRLWNEIRAERKSLPLGCPEDLALGVFADAVFFLSDNLNVDAHGAARVVGVTVKILRPLPDLPPGHLWHRTGSGQPWAPKSINEIPDFAPCEPSLHLAAIYRSGDGFAVVGYDRPLPDYDAAATVSRLVSTLAHCGLTTGLSAARSFARKELPGADAAMDLAERLSGAVEGL